MARAALGHLAAADATQLGAAAQARCLKAFEQADAIGTAARAYRVGQADRGQSPFRPVTSVMPMSGSVALGRARMGS